MKTEDHSLSALIVKEDGLIYVNEVPEEPKTSITGFPHPLEWHEYEEALASAKESAVLCADQKQAGGLIFWNWHKNASDYDVYLGLMPGIYPIPDLQWEVDDRPLPHYPKVAILKESTPLEKEIHRWDELRHGLQLIQNTIEELDARSGRTSDLKEAWNLISDFITTNEESTTFHCPSCGKEWDTFAHVCKLLSQFKKGDQTEQESQEELWLEAIQMYNTPSRIIDPLDKVLDHYTITRKP